MSLFDKAHHVIFVLDFRNNLQVRNWSEAHGLVYYHFHSDMDVEVFMHHVFYLGLRDAKEEQYIPPFTRELRAAKIIQSILVTHYGKKLRTDLCQCIQTFLPLWRTKLIDFQIDENMVVENYERTTFESNDCDIM